MLELSLFVYEFRLSATEIVVDVPLLHSAMIVFPAVLFDPNVHTALVVE
jgi:hypothetical protein